MIFRTGLIIIRADLSKLNEILDRLTLNGFFTYYRELREYYEYLAIKYNFDLRTHGVDPITGEVVPLNQSKFANTV